MKIIKKIKLSTRSIKPGAPLKVEVELYKNLKVPVYIQINGQWGSRQIFYPDGLPGERTIQVRAVTDDQTSTDYQTATFKVKAAPASVQPFYIRASPVMGNPNLFQMQVSRPPARAIAPAYDWYVNGDKVAYDPAGNTFLDLSDKLDNHKLFTEVELKVIERLEDGSIGREKTRFLSLASQYQFFKRQGVLIPPIENDYLLEVIRNGHLYYNLKIQNIEKEALVFHLIQWEFLQNDSNIANSFKSEAIIRSFQIQAESKDTYHASINTADLPKNIGGFIVRLFGTSASGMPAKIVAHFEFALQMRKETVDIATAVEVDAFPWDDRPWFTIFKDIAVRHFPQSSIVKDGVMDVAGIKHLFSSQFEKVKPILNKKTDWLGMVSGIEIKDRNIKNVIEDLASTTIVGSNLQVSTQLHDQLIANQWRFESSKKDAEGSEIAEKRDGDPPFWRLDNILTSGHVGVPIDIGTTGLEKEGQECQPDADAPSDQLICQLTNEKKDVLIPAKIVNAKKGDIILSAGGPSGDIGGLLNSLFPPQWYSHCGIMQESYYRILHCTGSKDWLRDHPIGQDIPLDGEDTLPMDGFDHEAIKFFWPGTVSQSVEDAFNGSEFEAPLQIVFTYPLLGPPVPEVRKKRYKIKAFNLGAVSSNQEHPFIDVDGNEYTNAQFLPLVVSMPPQMEAQHPELRQILHQIADKAATIKGHYSFYAYSDADIAFKPEFFAPVKEGYWASGTRPLMCSSLIWAAVREVFEHKGILEGRSIIVTDQDLEKDHDKKEIRVKITKDGKTEEFTTPFGMVDDPAAPNTHKTKDGLYFYTEDERKAAAHFLKNSLRNNIHEKYDKSFLKLGWGMEALTGMAEHVSNQMCNVFAYNKPDIISHAWAAPGVGRSVSPDNIKDFWDAPIVLPDGSIHGLYGHQEPMIYRPGRIERMAVSRWKKKPPTTGKIKGRVLFNGVAVPGVRVAIGNRVGITKQDGTFAVTLSTGSYRLNADKTIGSVPASATLEIFDLNPGEERDIEVILTASKRVLFYFAHLYVQDYEDIGKNETSHFDWGTEAAPRSVVLDADINSRAPIRDRWVVKFGGEIRVETEVAFTVNTDLSVNAEFKLLFFEGDNENTRHLAYTTDWMQLTIPRDEPFYRSYPENEHDLFIGDPHKKWGWDAATFRIWFKNQVATY